MEYNDEQKKYFSYLEETIIPQLKERGLAEVANNLESNVNKLQSGALDVATYVLYTKDDAQSVVDSGLDYEEGVDFAKRILNEIDGFFSSGDEVDVEALLEEKASNNAEKLDWKNSVVDLCKLVGLDSSYDARKKYAADLGFQGEPGSAEMNTFLQEEIKNVLAKNNGQIPQALA